MSGGALKPSILVAGNCNAGVARNALSHLGILTDSADLYYTPPEPTLWDQELKAAISRCVICFLQVRRDTRKFEEWLIAGLPAGCKVVRFPPGILLSLWPFVMDDLRNPPAILPTLSEGPYPRALTNRFVLDNLAKGDSAETAAARFLDLDLSKYSDFDRLHTLSLTLMRSIERDCDLVLADFIERNIQRERLFLSPGHPAGPVFAELARQMVEAIGIKPSGAVDALLQRLRGFRGVGGYDAPIHPAVTAHFGLAWTGDLAYRHFHEGSFTHDEYVRRFAGFAYTRDYYEGIRLVDEGRPRDAVSLLQRAVDANPRSPQFHLSLCGAAASLNDPVLLATITRRATEACPDDGPLWLRRARACFECGEQEAALKATDQALAWGADPGEAWQLRGWILGRIGRREEAEAAARRHSWYRSLEALPRPLVEPTGGEFGRSWVTHPRGF